MEVLESVALAPQASLHLVRVDARELLVAAGSARLGDRLDVRELIDRV